MRAELKSRESLRSAKESNSGTLRRRLEALRARTSHQLGAESQFIDAMRSRGLVLPQRGLITDGRIHRCDVAGKGKRGKGDGSYAFYPNGHIPAGWFTNWTDGRGAQNWHYKTGRPLSEPDRRHLDSVAERARREGAEYKAEARKRAREKASRIWRASKPASPRHPYSMRKKVRPEGLRTAYQSLLVPVYGPNCKLQSLQVIDASGNKRFLKGGRVRGCHYWVARPDETESETICVCEGWATGESIYQATKHAVLVAFDAGNLKSVAEWARERYPNYRIIMAADDDPGKNPGVTHAKEAARAVHGLFAVPDFGSERRDGDTDFNDMLQASGKEAVKRAIDAAASVAEAAFDEDEQADKERPAKRKQADVLADLASKAELFHSHDGVEYADIIVDGHRETWPIRSRPFRNWLLQQYYELTKSAPNPQAVSSALAVVGARAQFGAPERDVHVRVAGHEGKIYLDLADPDWRAVEISNTGWRIVEKPPVRFRRTRFTVPLPVPVKGAPS